MAEPELWRLSVPTSGSLRRRTRERRQAEQTRLEGEKLAREWREQRLTEKIYSQRRSREELATYEPWGRAGGGAPNARGIRFTNIRERGIIPEDELRGTNSFEASRRCQWMMSPQRRQRRTPSSLRLREDPQLFYAENLRKSVDNDIRYRKTPGQQRDYKAVLDDMVLQRQKALNDEMNRNLDYERKMHTMDVPWGKPGPGGTTWRNPRDIGLNFNKSMGWTDNEILNKLNKDQHQGHKSSSLTLPKVKYALRDANNAGDVFGKENYDPRRLPSIEKSNSAHARKPSYAEKEERYGINIDVQEYKPEYNTGGKDIRKELKLVEKDDNDEYTVDVGKEYNIGGNLRPQYNNDGKDARIDYNIGGNLKPEYKIDAKDYNIGGILRPDIIEGKDAKKEHNSSGNARQEYKPSGNVRQLCNSGLRQVQGYKTKVRRSSKKSRFDFTKLPTGEDIRCIVPDDYYNNCPNMENVTNYKERLPTPEEAILSVTGGVELVPLLARRRRVGARTLHSSDVTRPPDDSCQWREMLDGEHLRILKHQMNVKCQQKEGEEAKVKRQNSAEGVRRHHETWASLWGRPGHGAPQQRGRYARSNLAQLLYANPMSNYTNAL